LHREGYEVFENKIKNNIKIVLYSERGIFKYMDNADTRDVSGYPETGLFSTRYKIRPEKSFKS